MDPASHPTTGWGTVVDSFADADHPVTKPSLLDAMTDLRRDVAATAFPLPLPGVERARERRTELLEQLDDHLLPRLRELSAPGLVVVAGSTGAGKSTLVNSLLGAEVSPAGVLRPTTRRPVLVHHPADDALLVEHPLRPQMDVVAHDGVPRGIALVDAPDLDSLLAANRETAERLLDAADLWLFVTTAARYGDALPWHVLDRAAQRGVSVAMVLNRVPAEAFVTVRGDLLGRLGAHGLGSVPLFTIPDAGPHEGLLPPAALVPVRRWLTVLAGADRAQGVIARTQRGALKALRPWVAELAEAVDAQVQARAQIEAALADVLDGPALAAAAAVGRGSVAEGPVRAAWVARSGRGGPFGGGWTSRRGTPARDAALAEMAAELAGAARVALVAARRTGDRAVAARLGDRIAGLPPAPEAGPGPDEEAAAWLAAATERVRVLAAPGAPTHKAATRLIGHAGATGAGTLVAAAAVGLGAARALLEKALGAAAGREAADAAAADLAERIGRQVRAAGLAVRAALDTPDLAADAASRLELRRAVLKEWT